MRNRATSSANRMWLSSLEITRDSTHVPPPRRRGARPGPVREPPLPSVTYPGPPSPAASQSIKAEPLATATPRTIQTNADARRCPLAQRQQLLDKDREASAAASRRGSSRPRRPARLRAPSNSRGKSRRAEVPCGALRPARRASAGRRRRRRAAMARGRRRLSGVNW